MYVHDNKFYANAGIVTDSIFPGHPGLPRTTRWTRNNKIYSNNIQLHGGERAVRALRCASRPSVATGDRRRTSVPRSLSQSAGI